MNQLPHSLHATVKEINDNGVKLETESGDTILWPKHKIAKVNIGERVELIALSQHDIEGERAALAKQMMSYMLTGDEGAL